VLLKKKKPMDCKVIMLPSKDKVKVKDFQVVIHGKNLSTEYVGYTQAIETFEPCVYSTEWINVVDNSGRTISWPIDTLELQDIFIVSDDEINVGDLIFEKYKDYKGAEKLQRYKDGNGDYWYLRQANCGYYKGGKSAKKVLVSTKSDNIPSGFIKKFINNNGNIVDVELTYYHGSIKITEKTKQYNREDIFQLVHKYRLEMALNGDMNEKDCDNWLRMNL
jgi:hypothetical protein